MTTNLSDRVQQIQPSPTFAFTARVKELKRQNKDVIYLSAGEADFDTPQHIKQTAIDAINNGFTKYTPIDGIETLKQAVIDKFAHDNQLQYQTNQIIVSTGAKQCIYNLFQAILNKGDEVIVPAPFWPSYLDIVKLAEGVPKIIKTNLDQAFKITAEQLAKAITPATKAIILNSPNNPSGAVYSATELKALSEVLLRYPNITVVSDDVYEHIRWSGDPFVNMANIRPELQANTVVVNGVSKAYAMTGWRIGYAAGPVSIIAAMKKIQSQSTSCANSIAQMATQAALQGNQDCVKQMAKTFKERHDLTVTELNTIEGITCLFSEGTFYCFPNIKNLIKKLRLNSDTEFCDQLLDQTGVALLPGSVFGLPDHLRFSYTAGIEKLTEALQRIRNFLL